MVKDISIITICKNYSDGLLRTGQSLALQQGCDFEKIEWIIVDGSDGEELEKTKQVKESFGSLVTQFYTGSSDGIYPAMNLGMEAATGKYQWYMNAGDIISKEDIVATLSMEMALNPEADFIYGDFYYKQEYRKMSIPKDKKPGKMPSCHQSMLFLSSTMESYDTSYKIAADYLTSIKVFNDATNPLYVGRALCGFEANGISEKKRPQALLECYRARKESGLVPMKENVKMTAISLGHDFLQKKSPFLFDVSRNIYRKYFKKTDTFFKHEVIHEAAPLWQPGREMVPTPAN